MPALLATANPVFAPMSITRVPSPRAWTASTVPSLDPLSTTVTLSTAPSAAAARAVQAGQHQVAAVVADDHHVDVDHRPSRHPRADQRERTGERGQ